MLNYFEKISSGPITKDKDGQLTYGFHFSITKTWEKTHTDEQGGYFEKTDDEEWTIYPNGQFEYDIWCMTKGYYGGQKGEFDSSKYEEFVNQMKEYKRDWMIELSYHEETADFTYV